MRYVVLAVVALASVVMADGISGKITAVDTEKGCFQVHGVPVVAKEAAVVDRKGEALPLSSLKKGKYVIVEGTFKDDKLIATNVVQVKKVRVAIVEGTVLEVNGLVKYIKLHGVKVQLADGGDITNDLGHELALEMIMPGAHISCRGEWRDDKFFYADHIQQDVAAVEVSATEGVTQLPASITEGAVIEIPAEDALVEDAPVAPAPASAE